MKLGEAKRIKHARQHLRDCPERIVAANEKHYYCAACNAAKAVFRELKLELPELPNRYDGAMW